MKHQIRRYSGDFVALLSLFAVGLLVGGYVLAHQAQRIRFPWEAKPFVVRAAFANARGVLPGQGQSVRIAGVQVGLVANDELRNGQAIVTFDIRPKYRGLIHTDATALLRPQTGVKDMFVELDPGTVRAPAMRNHGFIPIEHTAPDVNSDEVLSTLDSDTRAYLQLLVNGLGKGLKGRGDDLRDVLSRFEPLHRDLARVGSAVAARRVELARLVHNYGQLVRELGDHGGDLTRLVRSSNQVFEAFASQNQNISTAVGRLPGALGQTSRTLVKVNALARVLGPAVTALRPPFRQLDATNRQVRPALRTETPILQRHIRPFVRTARPYTRNLRPAAIDLAKATPDLTSGFHELNRFFNMGSYNPNGREPVTGNPVKDAQRQEGYLYWLGWAAHNGESIFSTADASGPFRRATLFATCDTFDSIVNEQPAAEQLLGLTSLLNDPHLCNQPSK